LADIYNGRNMAGIKRGEIKKLLVLESLPMPIHYTGGMEPISYGGTFTLERLVGTVPVEEDGSAYLELPALRSFFFVALDKNDLSVKRMQSFLTVQPGETTSCVGCHEQRTQTPRPTPTDLAAVRRPPSRIEPIAGVPEVIDYPRDIQPVLDALCVSCHGYEKTATGGPRAGKLILTGDHGPLYSHSYYMLTIARLISDGRNLPQSNYAPRKLGSSASRLLTLLDGAHYGVQATPRQKQLLRLWIESGAAYPGTYAALGCGMVGNYAENQEIHTGADWPATRAAAEVIEKRCAACHAEPARLLPLSLADERGVSFWEPSLDDPRLLTSRHIVFNLSRPAQSLLLLAPLAESVGGWGLCRDPKTRERQTVFADTADPGYQALLALCVAGKDALAQDTRRFDMPGFRPRADWVREMKRYSILPADLDPAVPINCYAVERKYWESLWYKPALASP
jgi:cytochrome c553